VTHKAPLRKDLDKSCTYQDDSRRPLCSARHPTGRAKAPRSARTQHRQRPDRLSVPGELEAAVVKAEGEHRVVGEVAFVDEPSGEPLGGNRVAGV
jgi:hypothetical protein